MSTTPPEEPGGYGAPPNVNFNLNALMPTPGNAELVVYILATLLLTSDALVAELPKEEKKPAGGGYDDMY